MSESLNLKIKRPLGVWLILLGYLIYVLPQFLYFLVFYLGRSEIKPSDLAIPGVAEVISASTGPEGIMTILVLILNLTAAIVLFNYKKISTKIFLIGIGMVALQKIYLIINWDTKIDLDNRIFGSIVGFIAAIAIPTAIVIYIRKLSAKNILN